MCDDSSIFDVADYGAVGDGVTDDTDAIQRAIDAACAWSQDHDGSLVSVRFSADVYQADGRSYLSSHAT